MFSYSKDSNQKILSNYKDVRTNFWYSDSISLLVLNNLMTGYGDGSFKPNDNITRAEVSKVLSLMFDFENATENSKYDNEIKNTWYEPYVKELVNAGIINGYQDGRFNANNKMTRAEMIALLRRIIETKFGKVELSEDITNPFSDVLKTDWFYEDVLKCTKR